MAKNLELIEWKHSSKLIGVSKSFCLQQLTSLCTDQTIGNIWDFIGL